MGPSCGPVNDGPWSNGMGAFMKAHTFKKTASKEVSSRRTHLSVPRIIE